MRILLVNKFLHPNGGSETYMFQLGGYLESIGHAVQYFGMDHPQRCVGNSTDSYTSNMDFHSCSGLSKISYAFRTIYSKEARKKIRTVLDDFQPDVVHINNFNYQLTPSIILEVMKWKKDCSRNCRIVYTAHDFQLVCPNHQLFNPIDGRICEKCLKGGNRRFFNCFRGKCIHDSRIRSLIGSCEAYYWNTRGVYRNLDAIICPSEFMKEKLDTNPVLASRTVFLRNFKANNPNLTVDKSSLPDLPKRYVLYFGRFSTEKGIGTLLKAIRMLPDIRFVLAGSGPLKDQLDGIGNIIDVGFLSGGVLSAVIGNASFSVITSEWFENCPYSVIESLMLGTPVLGARIGGIPELIQDGRTGELFTSGDVQDLAGKIRSLWDDEERVRKYSDGCRQVCFDDVGDYTVKLMPIYEGKNAGR